MATTELKITTINNTSSSTNDTFTITRAPSTVTAGNALVVTSGQFSNARSIVATNNSNSNFSEAILAIKNPTTAGATAGYAMFAISGANSGHQALYALSQRASIDVAIFENNAATGSALCLNGISRVLVNGDSRYNLSSEDRTSVSVGAQGNGGGIAFVGYTNSITVPFGAIWSFKQNSSASDPSGMICFGTSPSDYPSTGNTIRMVMDVSNALRLRSDGVVGFSSATTPQTTAVDAAISRVGSNTLGVGSGASGNATGTLRVTTVQAPAATALNLGDSATTRWTINTSGHFLAASDNTLDIGASGATRPRNIFAATSVVVGSGVTVNTSGSAGFVLGGTSLTLAAGGSNDIQFQTNGVVRWKTDSTGNFIANADDTYDVGASGATRPRTGYFGTSVITPLFSNGAALSITTTASNGDITLDPHGTGVVALAANVTTTGKVTNYNSIATAGWGTLAVYGAANITGQTTNATIATYTVGAADGDFLVGATINVTAATSLSTTLEVAYTDVANNARTITLTVIGSSGAITTTGDWTGTTQTLRAKASTTITVRTSAGTFTGVTYSASAHISQVA